MKKIVLLLLLVLLTACSDVKECEPDGRMVCLSFENNSFKIEENATLTIAVGHKGYGEAIVNLWNEIHPDHANAVKYVEVDNYQALTYFSKEIFDLMYVSEDTAALMYDTLAYLDKDLVEMIQKNNNDDLVINKMGYCFVPMEYQGFVFAYNQDLLEQLNLDLTDANADNLPDSVDSFEKIFDLMDSELATKVFCFYPLSFKERYSLYPVLSAGGFIPFESNNSSEPNFDTLAFKRSLVFIEELSKHQLYPNTSLTASDLPYALEDVLVENSTLFTLISNQMYINYDSKNTNYHFSKMPTYQGNTLTPLREVYGYVLNKNCEYPSAASELIRLIRSIDGIDILIDETKAIPAVTDPDLFDEIDQEKREKIKAYAYSVSEPLIALNNNQSKRVWDMYYEIDILPVLRALFDQQISVNAAQDSIVEMVNNWLEENDK